MNNINELIERAHSQAKAMGWWDKERNIGELLMLIVSKCGEALEAHRSGRRFDKLKYDIFMSSVSVNPFTGEYKAPLPEKEKSVFESCVKDTFEDELADIVIRIADMIGGLKINVSSGAKDPFSYDVEKYEQWKLSDNVGQFLFERVVSSLCGFHYKLIDGNQTIPGTLYHTPLSSIDVWCKAHNIDLWRHIDLKLKYNLTRGNKHGKAY